MDRTDRSVFVVFGSVSVRFGPSSFLSRSGPTPSPKLSVLHIGLNRTETEPMLSIPDSNGKAEVRAIEMKACNVTHCRKCCHCTSMESRWSCTSRFSSSRRGSAQRVQAPCFHHIREKFLQNLDIRSIPENRYCNPNLRRHFGILSKVRFACIVDPFAGIAMHPPYSLACHPHLFKASDISLTGNVHSSLDHLMMYHRIHEHVCQNGKLVAYGS